MLHFINYVQVLMVCVPSTTEAAKFSWAKNISSDFHGCGQNLDLGPWATLLNFLFNFFMIIIIFPYLNFSFFKIISFLIFIFDIYIHFLFFVFLGVAHRVAHGLAHWPRPRFCPHPPFIATIRKIFCLSPLLLMRIWCQFSLEIVNTFWTLQLFVEITAT